MRKQELVIFISVIIFMALIFLVFILVSLFSSPQNQPPQPTPNPSTSLRPLQQLPSAPPSAPAPIPLPTTLPQLPTEPAEYSIISLLPIQTDFANIEFLASSNSYAVTIKKNPYQENKTKVEDWFKSAGLDPSTLEIYWQTYPEVTIE